MPKQELYRVMNTEIRIVLAHTRNALKYLEEGCIWSAVIVLMAIIGSRAGISARKNGIRKSIIRFFFLYLFVVYLYCVLWLTIFSRAPGSFGGIDLRILAKWSHSPMERALFIENIMMFIPMGIFLPIFWPMQRHVWLCMPTAVLCSVCIEGIQLGFGLGYCQLDDIIANAGGFLIGFGVWFLVKSLGRVKKGC